jgi:hypothetical protein
MQVVELAANTWLTRDDRQAVEQLLSEHTTDTLLPTTSS